jgi:hypothetical protein
VQDRLLSSGAVEALLLAMGEGFEAIQRHRQASELNNILIHGSSTQSRAVGEAPQTALMESPEFLGKYPLATFHDPRLELAHLASALFPRRVWGKRVMKSGGGILGFGSKCNIERGMTPQLRRAFSDPARLRSSMSADQRQHAPSARRAQDKVIPGKERRGRGV